MSTMEGMINGYDVLTEIRFTPDQITLCSVEPGREAGQAWETTLIFTGVLVYSGIY